MTSVQTEFQAPEPYTKFFTLQTLCYDDNTEFDYLPVPFSVENGVLDIVITNSDVQDFVNSGGYERYCDTKVTSMGGRTLVQSLGPNMITWLQNYTSAEGPFTIVVAPTMVKVQPRGVDSDYDALRYWRNTSFHTRIPTGDEYIMAGTPTGQYYSTWVFDTPLTISFEGEGTQYLTLNSAMQYLYT